MKLVKGVITSDEDENITMSKDTFYEMDNNFNITLKENKRLKKELDLQFKDLMKRIQENNDKYLEEKNKLIKEKHHLKNILTELEEWLKEQNDCYYYGIRSGKTLLYGKFLGRVETLNKIQELKEKYK